MPPKDTKRYTKMQYEARKAAGFCVSCGKGPLVSKVLCEPCVQQRRVYYASHPKKIYTEAKLAAQRVWRANLKVEVLAHYGNACACCGERFPGFLTIDHVHNDGAKHRLEIGSGTQMYGWLKRKGFPEGYQILCYNCNIAKYQFGGVCPHQIRNATDRIDSSSPKYSSTNPKQPCLSSQSAPPVVN